MNEYLFRRVITIIPTIVILTFIIFVLMRVLPGDVARLILTGPSGDGTPSAEAVERLRAELSLDQPLYRQYAGWISDLVVGSGGKSYVTRQTVYSEIQNRFLVTVQLTLGATIVSVLMGIPLGVISAARRGSKLDALLRGGSVIALAIPHFWLGVIIIVVMSRSFGWVSPLGYTPIWEDAWRNVQQMFFPTLVLGASTGAVLARWTRSSVLDVLRSDYIRTAYSKGLSDWQVLMGHALRSSLIPIVTVLGLQFGVLFGGAVVTEQVFSLPGLGRLLVSAIAQRDYPTVQALILITSLIFMVINLLTDVLYGILDPRIKYS